jgi:hypothetical protein
VLNYIDRKCLFLNREKITKKELNIIFSFKETNRIYNYKLFQAIQKVQNKGLRAVAEAYCATPIKELEKEVLVLPIDIYCSKLRARHIRRTCSFLAGVFIQEQYKIIRERLKQRRRKRA